MNTIITDRLSTIAALIVGSGSGYGLSQVIDAPELKTWMITISVAVSLLLSLIISLSLMGRMTVAKRDKLTKKGWYVLIGFLAFIAVFFIYYNKYTIKIPWVNQAGQIGDTVIVKGLKYTTRASIYRDSVKSHDQFGNYPTDDVLLDDATYDIRKVWSDDSRTNARLVLLFLYTIMTCFLIAGVTLIVEGIIHSRKKSSRE